MYQFEPGELSLGLTKYNGGVFFLNKNLLFYDLSDEVSAYQRGELFGQRENVNSSKDVLAKDGSSNTYEVVNDYDISTPGVARGANEIKVRRSHKDDGQTGPHEVGHTLLMEHEGTNSGGVMADGNTGASSVYNNNIQQTINYALDHAQPRRVTVHGNLPRGKVKSNPNKKD